MFGTLLIANRGEIACRIIRTARRMGLKTVAVFSDADADALHVEMADQAVRIGPPSPRVSYLNRDALLQAAGVTGAEAIHPGYGFLSENAEFAEHVHKAGLVFVGPPAPAIRAMGGKSEAKALMAAAGVPVLPGYHGEDQTEARLAAEAARIGFPVMIKASAGGGGKGMRVVEGAAEFAAALAAARREASGAFGDDRMLIERCLIRPRHIEIQVFADTLGHCVYLFERDCSIQRRHQKVVEEAPGPGLLAAARSAMGAAAVKAAQAISYVGAGTVEFLLGEDGSFFFMEMNTRLQVEHPVTEMITGQDLVEWQLRVAAGEPLPLTQDALTIGGHAIEVRLYAEDPLRGFLPQTGRLDHLRLPQVGQHVRVDTGVRGGDQISIHYDPMIAKLAVWDRTRAAAVRQLKAALAQIEIAGVSTNAAFLARIAAHPAYAAGDIDTGFIERYSDDLLQPPAAVDQRELAIVALAVLADRDRQAGAAAAVSLDPASPWAMRTGWCLNGVGYEEVELDADGVHHNIKAYYRPAGSRHLEVDGVAVEASGSISDDGALLASVDGVTERVRVVLMPKQAILLRGPLTRRLGIITGDAGLVDGDRRQGRLQSPMPGRVIAVLTEAGQQVTQGQSLVVLEAMKMEHTIKAPYEGTIKTVCFAVGDQVPEAVDLVVFEEIG